MPNHVYNILEFDKEIKKIKTFMKSKALDFDFNKVIPMPNELIGTKSPCKTNKKLIACYGYDNWYDWCIHNWGTKWNAYDIINDDPGCICFNTAWSSPFPIIKELSKLFPKVKFTLKYADEDLGNNCGTYVFKNGTIIEEEKGDLAFACELHGVECKTCTECGQDFSDWEGEDKCYECLNKENN